jgi:hypothetical protein
MSAGSALDTITAVAGTEFRRAHIVEEYADGVNAGASTTGSWNTKGLNKVLENAIPGASLSSNQVTLPAGTYRFTAEVLNHRPQYHRARLQNITDATTIKLGVNNFISTTDTASGVVSVAGRFTLATQKTIELQYRVSNANPAGEGPNDLFAGTIEYYSELIIDQEVDATRIKGIETGKLFHSRDEKAATNTGGSSTASIWDTRTLNTDLVNEIDGASRSGNTITLPAGTYYAEASAPTFRVGVNRLRLRDTGSSANLLLGQQAWSNNDQVDVEYATLSGKFTLSASTTVELQHYCGIGRASDGLGVANGTVFDAGNQTEVYAEIRIWKVDA